MHLLKRLLIPSFLLIPVLGMPPLVAAAERGDDVPVFVHKGTVDVIDLESSRLMVSGMEFEVPAEVTVTIRGGPGAFTMLQEGMKAEVVYREYPDARVATQVDQLPDNAEIEQY